ncbi:MAG: N utilization substance protein B [Patiriisocius sp.]|jgi:N utilization substance protein B
MLNRRHLRIKILLALYAYYSSEERDLPKGERQLIFSINKFFELYVMLFSTIIALKGYAQNRIEMAKQRLVPTGDDLNPKTRFVDNRFIGQIEKNSDLHSAIENFKISWDEEQRAILKNLYEEMLATEIYQSYMSAENNSYEDDKKFVLALFKENICNNERLQGDFEEKSIFWSDDLDLASSMVIKTLKKVEQTKPLELLPLYKDHDERMFAIDLYRQAVITNDENMALIKDKLKNWDEDRLAKMDVLLMKMALSEAKHFPSIPYKVTMNEYIEISKFYSTPDSKKFINGILDKLFDQLKKDGGIKKIGRGLLDT